MNNFLKDLLVFAYTIVGVFSLIAYVPTIKDLLKKKPSANISSYLLWSFTSLIGLLYAIFIVPDPALIFVSLITFLACFIVLILRLRIKD